MQQKGETNRWMAKLHKSRQQLFCFTSNLGFGVVSVLFTDQGYAPVRSGTLRYAPVR